MLRKIGNTHVRHKADCHFWHGGAGSLSHDSVGAVHGNSQATAHSDAINNRDIWFGLRKFRNHRVHLVLVPEELLPLLRNTIEHSLPNCAHVTTGTKRLGVTG